MAVNQVRATIIADILIDNNWLPPKTDWGVTDRFNVTDYNRIINNLRCLKELSLKLYNAYSIENMGADNTISDFPYATKINRIENNLETINLHTANFDIGSKKTYAVNGRFIDYNELNRIERAIKLLYETMVWSINALPRLSFKLGGEKGIKI